MKVIFRSRDFASIDSAGLGFNHRRPMAETWHYQGRVQHRDWQGTFTCYWEHSDMSTGKHTPTEIVWTVSGNARLFGLAAALKARGYQVDVEQDNIG